MNNRQEKETRNTVFSTSMSELMVILIFILITLFIAKIYQQSSNIEALNEKIEIQDEVIANVIPPSLEKESDDLLERMRQEIAKRSQVKDFSEDRLMNKFKMEITRLKSINRVQEELDLREQDTQYQRSCVLAIDYYNQNHTIPIDEMIDRSNNPIIVDEILLTQINNINFAGGANQYTNNLNYSGDSIAKDRFFESKGTNLSRNQKFDETHFQQDYSHLHSRNVRPMDGTNRHTVDSQIAKNTLNRSLNSPKKSSVFAEIERRKQMGRNQRDARITNTPSRNSNTNNNPLALTDTQPADNVPSKIETMLATRSAKPDFENRFQRHSFSRDNGIEGANQNNRLTGYNAPLSSSNEQQQSNQSKQAAQLNNRNRPSNDRRLQNDTNSERTQAKTNGNPSNKHQNSHKNGSSSTNQKNPLNLSPDQSLKGKPSSNKASIPQDNNSKSRNDSGNQNPNKNNQNDRNAPLDRKNDTGSQPTQLASNQSESANRNNAKSNNLPTNTQRNANSSKTPNNSSNLNNLNQQDSQPAKYAGTNNSTKGSSATPSVNNALSTDNQLVNTPSLSRPNSDNQTAGISPSTEVTNPTKSRNASGMSPTNKLNSNASQRTNPNQNNPTRIVSTPKIKREAEIGNPTLLDYRYDRDRNNPNATRSKSNDEELPLAGSGFTAPPTFDNFSYSGLDTGNENAAYQPATQTESDALQNELVKLLDNLADAISNPEKAQDIASVSDRIQEIKRKISDLKQEGDKNGEACKLPL